MKNVTWLLVLVCGVILAGCGDDDENKANRLGVGAQCTANTDCSEDNQSCLLQFKGGYCGVAECTTDAGTTGCPAGSACVAHDDGHNYCFLLCATKTDCNVHRDAANEANCSSSVTFVDAAAHAADKACVPPSGN